MDITDYPNVTRCSLPMNTPQNAAEYCNLVKNTMTCGLFVNLINFMQFFFCDLQLPLIPVYGLCNALILICLFSMLHMMTKYFFFPNLLMLIEFTPTTIFGSSYLISGPCLLMPHYTSEWSSCAVLEENLSPVQFAKLVGDIMRHFVIGIMVLCIEGYKVNAVTMWSSILFVLLGLIYLLVVSNRKHYIPDMNLSKDRMLLEFRVLVFMLTFIIVLLVIAASSYTTFARSGLKKTKQRETFSDLESDDEILGSYPKQRFYSRRKIWWQTVNGYKIMGDNHPVYRMFMAPIFFILAHFIPVISKERFQLGWVKYINCFCFLILPVLCLFYKFNLANTIVAAIVCWTASFLVFISTHSMRRPDHVWLYSLLGLVISSLAMSVLNREIDNLIWQFMGLRFNLEPDITALMFFGFGEVFSEAIVVHGLQRRKLWDACFGFVMSVTTYGLFLAFPLMYYHQCYNVNCKIIGTASSGTCMMFLFLILSTTVLHISMSGYEFRISLFVFLMAEMFIYGIFQWMRHHDVVFPLTFLHEKK